jgi:hypothetical protein
MDKKKELVFDPQMIANCREVACNMIISDEIARRLLNDSTTIDYQTKTKIYHPYFITCVFAFMSFISNQYVVA